LSQKTQPIQPIEPVHACNIIDTVIVPHNRPITASYPIPAGCCHKFICTGWVGAQKVDIYHILKEQGGHDEKEKR
jgi:hypothetical protein